MGYPHIRGAVVAAEWQPSFIHQWPGIECPDFLRPFEDTPPPSTIVTLKCSYAHSGVAVGFLYTKNRRGNLHVCFIHICQDFFNSLKEFWSALKILNRLVDQLSFSIVNQKKIVPCCGMIA